MIVTFNINVLLNHNSHVLNGNNFPVCSCEDAAVCQILHQEFYTNVRWNKSHQTLPPQKTPGEQRKHKGKSPDKDPHEVLTESRTVNDLWVSVFFVCLMFRLWVWAPEKV